MHMVTDLLLKSLLVLVGAKLTALRLPFYSAAILTVAGLHYYEMHVQHLAERPLFEELNIIRVGAALILFYFLDRNESKPFRWFLTLLLTCIVLLGVIA